MIPVNFVKLTKQLKGTGVNAASGEQLTVALMHTTDALWGLAVIPANRVSMSNAEIGLLEELVNVMNNNAGVVRLNACSALVNLSYEPSLRIRLASNDVNLLVSTLKIIRSTGSGPADMKVKGCLVTILRNLSICPENKLIMTAPALGLIPTLAKLIKESFYLTTSAPVSGNPDDFQPVLDHKMINGVFAIASALASSPNARQYMAASTTGLMEAVGIVMGEYNKTLNGKNGAGMGGLVSQLKGGANDNTHAHAHENWSKLKAQSVEEETLDLICATLCLLSASALNLQQICNDRYGIMGHLLGILRRPQFVPKNNAVLALTNLCSVVINELGSLGGGGGGNDGASSVSAVSSGDSSVTSGKALAIHKCVNLILKSSADPANTLFAGVIHVFHAHLADEKIIVNCCELVKLLIQLDGEVIHTITDPSLSFLSSLSKCYVTHDANSACIEAVTTLVWYLSADPSNEIRFANKTLGLLSSIVQVLGQSANLDTKLAACAVISCLSCNSNNEDMMAGEELGLVQVLVTLMRHERQPDLRASACSIVSNLSVSHSNKVYFGDSTSCGVLAGLLVVILEDYGDARIHACSALKSISVSPVNKTKMTQIDLGLLNTLVKVIRRDHGKSREYCCSTISNLAVAADNKVIMGRSDLGILRSLQEVCMEDTGESRVIACAALSHLATATQNKLRMMRPDIDVFKALASVLHGDKGKAGLFACSALNHLSMLPQNKTQMASAEADFVPILVETIWEAEGKIVSFACSCLASLSTAVDNRVSLVSGGMGVVEALVFIITKYMDTDGAQTHDKKMHANMMLQAAHVEEGSDSNKGMDAFATAVLSKTEIALRVKTINHACASLRSLSVAAENKVQMASPQMGVLALLVKLLKSDYEEAKSNATFIVWNLAVNSENQRSMLEDESLGLLKTLVDIIESPKSTEKMRSNACGAVLNFTICAENETLMVEPRFNLILALARVLEKDTGKARDYATSALSNLSFTSDNKRALTDEKYNLVSSLSKTMRETIGETRSQACQCICRLSTSVSNRPIMTSIEYEYNLLQAIVFVLRAEEQPCEIRDHLCLTLSYLSDCLHNKPIMTMPKLGILPLLSEISETDNGNARTYALITLKNLSDDPNNQSLMTGGTNRLTHNTASNPVENSNMLPALITALSDSNDKSREVACVALANFASEEENKIPMADPELGLIQVLVQILNDDWTTMALGVSACSVLWGLADAVPNRITMMAPSLNLVPALVHVLSREQNTAEYKAQVCGICRSLAVVTENKPILGDLKCGLIEQLIKRLYEPDEFSLREYACAAISNLVVCLENKIAFALPHVQLYPALVFVCQHDTGGARVAACAACHFMACHPANLVPMCAPELELVEALMHVIATDKDGGDARSNACSAVCHLASSTENRVRLGGQELGLMPILVDVLREEEGKARVFSCSTIGFLSVSHENQKYIASYELGLLVEIVRIISTDRGKSREYCCSITRSLSSALSNKIYMAGDQLGLIVALIKVLQEDTGKARANACATVCNLAIATLNKIPMGRPSLGLIKALVRVTVVDKAEARVNACAALSYLAIAIENKVHLLDPSVGLLEALKTVIKEDLGKARVNACLTLSNLSITANGTTVDPKHSSPTKMTGPGQTKVTLPPVQGLMKSPSSTGVGASGTGSSKMAINGGNVMNGSGSLPVITR